MNPVIEIATSDFATTAAAVEGGADRIELCANLAEGGTTASYGTILECRKHFDVLLYPIIRPRGGDFLYSAEEFEVMMHEVKLCKQTGCDGIVIGLLRADGSIDTDRTARLVELAYPLGVTFHRAFDRCVDPHLALTQLIELGCERILTSGQHPAAPDGLELIRSLREEADHRITIMPGSGIRKENIANVARQTGCIEFHSSLRGKKQGAMQFIHPNFSGSAESYTNNSIDPGEVRALRAALNGIDFSEV